MATVSAAGAGSLGRSRVYVKDRRTRYRQSMDRVVTVVVTGATGVSIALLVIILTYVVLRGLPAITPSFFFERPLPFGEPGGGVGPAVLGSLVMLGMASL